MQQSSDTLLELLVQLLRSSTIDRQRLKYADLTGAARSVVDRTLNAGIPKDDAEFVKADVDGNTLLIAFYRSDEHDFTAAYAFRNDVVVHSYEN